MSTTPHLAIEGVRKLYGEVVALDDVSLSVGSQDYVVLLGPSGSGKTTLLSVIGGFTFPTAGSIRIAGRDVTGLGPAVRPTTTVFQDYALFPHMSVERNIGFGLKLRRVAAKERHQRVERALDMVGLAGFGARGVHELSGGQRQRVALARALIVEPEILLLDEPLGALDLNLRRQMQDELLALQRRTGRCFVHVTHDQEEAMALASLIVVMNKGRIEDAGPPQRVYARPGDPLHRALHGREHGDPGAGEGRGGGDGIRPAAGRGECSCRGTRHPHPPARESARRRLGQDPAGRGADHRCRVPGRASARPGAQRDERAILRAPAAADVSRGTRHEAVAFLPGGGSRRGEILAVEASA